MTLPSVKLFDIYLWWRPLCSICWLGTLSLISPCYISYSIDLAIMFLNEFWYSVARQICLLLYPERRCSKYGSIKGSLEVGIRLVHRVSSNVSSVSILISICSSAIQYESPPPEVVDIYWCRGMNQHSL